jgi:hypothetical protein
MPYLGKKLFVYCECQIIFVAEERRNPEQQAANAEKPIE